MMGNSEKKVVNKKTLIVALALITVVVIMTVVLLSVYGKTEKDIIDEQLILGDKYMSELNYEQAIATYEAILVIDPKCADAYRELGDLYVLMGDYDKAVDILKAGYDILRTENLLSQIEKIENLLAENNSTTDEETTTEDKEILDEVKEVKNYWLKKKTVYGDGGTVSDIEEYDQNKNVVSSEHYFHNLSEFWTYEYEYDECGKVLKKIAVNTLLDSGEIYAVDTYEYEYVYDENGILREEKQRDDIYDTEALYVYDENGYLIKHDEKEWGTLKWWGKRTYNDMGSTYTSYDEQSDESKVYLVEKFDVKERLVEKIEIDIFDDYVKTYTYEYEERDNHTMACEGYESEDYVRTVKYNYKYSYDANSNCIRKEIYRVNEDDSMILTGHIVYEYDEFGHLVLEDWISSGGSSTRRIKSEYSEMGEILRTDVYVEGKIDESMLYNYEDDLLVKVEEYREWEGELVLVQWTEYEYEEVKVIEDVQ